jgi:hypothetical protein
MARTPRLGSSASRRRSRPLANGEEVLGACPLEPECSLQTAPAAEDEHVNVGDSRVPLCRLKVGIG